MAPIPGSFTDLYPFGLDDFQLRACQALQAGDGVLVAAPTGSGKTVVGEFAVHLALAGGTKCFYTTPIKALSNQKYHDLVARYGPARVGLLTGDNSVNPDAPVIVMTTEVLRNMIYADSDALSGLAFVVMDEVHYLADRERGPVWEEVIINLPAHVAVVALSATVSNAEEFGDWLSTVRGDTTVIVEEHRPVPLLQHVLADGTLLDLFVEGSARVVNPELVRLARSEQRLEKSQREFRLSRHPHRGGSSRPERGGKRPRSAALVGRPEAVDVLRREKLLPAIVFIFSRAGCEAAVEQCLRAGLRLTTPAERERIATIINERVATLAHSDLAVLGFQSWSDALGRGIAAHHAGLIPTFKETVEELFQAGLVKVVFATETLALGINMPAKAVLLERLVKWNGETHAEITPGEYTQLTGRAGRRGIDVEGHAVVGWHPGLDPTALAGLASTRTYPLRSSFVPSYNMAVNLVAGLGRPTARRLLETSFAQFQADRGYVGLAATIARNEEAIAGYEESMSCHLGDFAQYAALRAQISQREKHLARTGVSARRDEVAGAVAELVAGDVIVINTGRRVAAAVVLDPGLSAREEPRPFVLTVDRAVQRLSVHDFPEPPKVLTTLRIPAGFSMRSPNSRRDLAAHLRMRTDGMELPRPRHRGNRHEDAQLLELRAQLRAHPCHGCADREEHARWGERAWRVRRETEQLRRRLHARTDSVARQFDAICGVLAQLGYLTTDDDSAAVSPRGRGLARIYGESDLLAMECIRAGVWDGLTAPELAGAASVLVYQSRGGQEDGQGPRIPAALRPVVARTDEIAETLTALERRSGLPGRQPPDAGFVWAAHKWAGGSSLSSVLAGGEMPAGDFVRWCKQVIDFLGQLVGSQADDPQARALADVAADAVRLMRRGVVAVSSIAELGDSQSVQPAGSAGLTRTTNQLA